MRGVAWAVLLLSWGAALGAQGLPKGEFPDGYRVRTDGAAGSARDIVFVTMRPGWHITTGAAPSVLYDGALRADGVYRVDAETFLFPPGERNQGYGLFVGGAELEGGAPTWTAFMVRTSGEFMVERRSGSTSTMVVDWTPHASILRYADRGQSGTAKNVLAIEANADNVRFLVNGAEVASLPRSRIGADGVVGLRVHDAVNLHVSSLVVTKR